MASEKVEVTSRPATDSSIEEFQRFGQGMQGERFQSGGRHDLEGRGYGSGSESYNWGNNDPAEGVPQRAREEGLPEFKQDVPDEEEPDFKQLYGRETNEKGMYRRTAEEAMEELKRIKSEYEALRYAVGQQGSYNQAPNGQYHQAPQGYYGAPQPQNQQQYQLPETFFPDKDPGEFVEVKDVDHMVKSAIAPAVYQLWQQQQQQQSEFFNQQKMAMGITPQIEQQLSATYQWINHLPHGEKLQAMKQLMSQQGQEEPKRPQPKQTMVSPEQAAARRVTYIESGQKSKPSESEIPLQQRIAQEFSQAKTAAEKRAVLMKYGMQHVNDWGADTWGPAR